MVVALLHIRKQGVKVRRFRNKDRRQHHLLQLEAGVPVLQEIVARVENANDVVLLFGVYRHAGVAFLLDLLHDLRIRRVQRDEHNGLSRHHHILGGHAVQLKDILYVFDVVPIQRALVDAGIQHQHDVLGRNRVLLRMRVDAEQAQHGVCRNRE